MVADATTFTISIIGVVNVTGCVLNKPYLKKFENRFLLDGAAMNSLIQD